MANELEVPMHLDHYVDVYPVFSPEYPIYERTTRLVLHGQIWEHHERVWANGYSYGEYKPVVDWVESDPERWLQYNLLTGGYEYEDADNG